MKTYDELYDYIKHEADEVLEQAINDDWLCGVYHAYRYVLDKMEEIRRIK